MYTYLNLRCDLWWESVYVICSLQVTYQNLVRITSLLLQMGVDPLSLDFRSVLIMQCLLPTVK